MGELLLMAGAIGLAVGLSRTPAPGSGDTSLSPAEELLGFDMPPALGGFPWTPLFTQWHFDPLFAFGTGAAALLYLAGVRTLRARGDKWPPGCTISWLLGLAGTVFATMSGLAVYGKVLFSVHMGQHMTLAMTVPILLVLGAPATLALRTLPAAPKGSPDGPREMLQHFLAVGLLFFWVVIGIGPGPRRPPHLGRLFVLILTMPFHSWFSISLMSSTELIRASWWSLLDRPWVAEPLDDQYNAGAIAWAIGDIPVLFTTVILAVQWVRSDQREARRIDRRIDQTVPTLRAVYDKVTAARDLHQPARPRRTPGSVPEGVMGNRAA